MTFSALVLILTCEASFLAAQTEPKELDRLRGTWLFTTGTMNGKPLKLPERALWRFTFGKDNKLLIRKTGYPNLLWGFAIDPSKSPKEIEMTIQDKAVGPGIYKLEGDSLTIAVADDVRPKDFEGKQGFLWKFTKQKPGPDDEIIVAKEKPKPGADAPRLAGRWELVTENRKTLDRTEIEISLTDKSLVLRRVTVTPIGKLKLEGKSTTRLVLFLEPDGKKNAIGIVEDVDKKKGEVTLSHVLFNFQGEILELFGQVTPPTIGNINLTGRWQRVGKRK